MESPNETVFFAFIALSIIINSKRYYVRLFRAERNREVLIPRDPVCDN